MRLTSPVIITPRLLPGVQIGSAFVSIEYSKRAGDETRTRYQYHIDLPESSRGERVSVSADDIQSGCQGGSLQEGLASLLSFLGACGDGFRYQESTGYESENASLFPVPVAQWAESNTDELGMLAIELEQTPDLIAE